MSFGESFPFSESLGVFFGVSGFEWLADGQAEPLKAVVIALAAGGILKIARQSFKRHR